MKHILVCMKAVPGTNQVQVDGQYRLQRNGVNLQWNVADESALEAANRLKVPSGTVTVLTMGPGKLEAPLRELSITLTDGPAKGVRSTPETAKHYDNIYSALRDAAPAKGKILVTSMLPFGYLMTDCLPASHSVWSSPWSERLEAYYALHPDRLPDLIVTVTPGVGFSSGDGDLAGLLNYLSDLGKSPVLITENESCKIYQVQ